jgi:hypothetical protein
VNVKAHIAFLASLLILLGCQRELENFRKATARTYTPTELWDAMLGSQAQEGHALSQTGPQLMSYIRIKGTISKIELPDPKEPTLEPALIFEVDRTSQWNGITLHGSVRAPVQSSAKYAVGKGVTLVCQVGTGAMPYVYMLHCE